LPADKKSSFVNVDELMPQITLEQVARHYGVDLPELHQIGSETRTRCFLTCGRTGETGDRALAIQTGHPAKQWHCHQYGCGKGGNLVSMCDLVKPGPSAGGKPRGERFKEIAADLKVIAGGEAPAPREVSAPRVAMPAAPPKANVPLRDSENERARALTELDRKFVVDVAAMPPMASAYVRRRPFLTPEVLRAWRVGYLPRDVGEDKSGGTMRGKIVYPYLSESGEVLSWFGRNVDFEEQWKAWDAAGRKDREPEKFHFVKGFHRGLELWGQHVLHAEGAEEKLKSIGLPVVEGPNDVICLATLDQPAVGLCSNTITREQAEKVACLARQVAGGVVTLFLDCDEEGENGARQALAVLAELVPVRLGWSSSMYGGTFKGRQPESLTADEWRRIQVASSHRA
jgi:hypothetical protein